MTISVSLTQQSNSAGVTTIAVLSDALVRGAKGDRDLISPPNLSLVSSDRKLWVWDGWG